MRVVAYQEHHREEWDHFVEHSKNGTFLHTRRFLAYHEPDKWKDASVLLYDNDELKAVFGACEYEGAIVSHQGSSTGGLVVRAQNRLEDSMACMQAISEYYAGHSEIRFKKHEYIFDRLPAQEVEFAALKHGFNLAFTELSTCVDLYQYQLSDNRMDKVKRASKKVTIKRDDDAYEAYYHILHKNLSEKHEVTPTHTMDEMRYLKTHFPDRFELFAAYHQNELIAGIWTISVTEEVLHIFYVAQNYDYKHLYATSLLVHDILEAAKERGFRYVNFGVSTEDKGEVLNKGLYAFKESFGGQGVYRSVFVKAL